MGASRATEASEGESVVYLRGVFRRARAPAIVAYYEIFDGSRLTRSATFCEGGEVLTAETGDLGASCITVVSLDTFSAEYFDTIGVCTSREFEAIWSAVQHHGARDTEARDQGWS